MKKAVKYIGKKPRVGVLVPVGVKQKTGTIGSVQFLRGKPTEMEAEDADKLCDLDANFVMDVKESAGKSTVDASAPKKRGRPKKTSDTGDFDSFMESKLGA